MKCATAPVFGSDIGDGFGEVPTMAVEILSVVLALAVGMVLRFAQNRGAVLASALFRRAAVFRWMRPLRAARSRSFTAANFAALLAPGAAAFLTAVRNAARWARLRTVAARVLRMFFLADAIFGTNGSPITIGMAVLWRAVEARVQQHQSQGAIML